MQIIMYLYLTIFLSCEEIGIALILVCLVWIYNCAYVGYVSPVMMNSYNIASDTHLLGITTFNGIHTIKTDK